MKDIKIGDEVTVDYGTIFGRQGTLECLCREKGCKKKLECHVTAADLTAVFDDYMKSLNMLKAYKGRLSTNADIESLILDSDSIIEEIENLKIRLKYIQALDNMAMIDDDQRSDVGVQTSFDLVTADFENR